MLEQDKDVCWYLVSFTGVISLRKMRFWVLLVAIGFIEVMASMVLRAGGCANIIEALAVT
jgi:hypothetical protein